MIGASDLGIAQSVGARARVRGPLGDLGLLDQHERRGRLRVVRPGGRPSEGRGNLAGACDRAIALCRWRFDALTCDPSAPAAPVDRLIGRRPGAGRIGAGDQDLPTCVRHHGLAGERRSVGTQQKSGCDQRAKGKSRAIHLTLIKHHSLPIAKTEFCLPRLAWPTQTGPRSPGLWEGLAGVVGRS